MLLSGNSVFSLDTSYEDPPECLRPAAVNVRITKSKTTNLERGELSQGDPPDSSILCKPCRTRISVISSRT